MQLKPSRQTIVAVARDAGAALGVLAICYGVSQIYVPASWITFGLFALTASVMASRIR